MLLKKYFWLPLFFFCSKADQKWERIQTATPLQTQAEEASNLLKRILPNHHQFFKIIIAGAEFAPKNKDQVLLVSKPSSTVVPAGLLKEEDATILEVTANTGVAAIWGVNHYLKYFCNTHISWDTTRIEIPSPLPEVNLTLTTVEKFRYYMNVCTFGYTYAFWQWPQWEKHIDWMALNGINLPLAFVAQEAIWDRVYRNFGLTTEDLNEHFAGPAFLPWQRMGNMEKWGGPLTPSWHTFTLELQHKTLDRMKGLGMTPVLPAFAGHIPKALVRLYPDITYTSASWNGFPSTYLLDPTDSMFNEIGSRFIEEYIKEFGETDHVYNCDSFNEMNPASNDPDFIRNSGKAIYEAISKVDENAVWVMQGWLFSGKFWQEEQAKALLTSVEPGEMLVLDLDSTEKPHYESLHSYFGQPFIFNDLNNFGGNVAFFGRIGNIHDNLPIARNMDNSTIVGIGITLEGLSDAYPTAELMLEMSWRDNTVNDIDAWFSNYTRRRYGRDNINASEAWSILSKNVLDATVKFPRRELLVCSLPNINMEDFLWYDVSDIATSWDHFMTAIDDLKEEEGFKFDLVDITRQFIINVAPKFYHLAITAYTEKDGQSLVENSNKFLDMLTDLDAVLATNKNFLLGPWLEDAKSIPNEKPEDAELYEFNARNQITLWGPNGEIMDYATKQWSGLVSDYYYPRWELFYQTLFDCIKYNTTFDFHDYKTHFLEEIGKPFTMDSKLYPTQAIGNTIEIAKKIYNKWRNEYDENDHFWYQYEYNKRTQSNDDYELS